MDIDIVYVGDRPIGGSLGSDIAIYSDAMTMGLQRLERPSGDPAAN